MSSLDMLLAACASIADVVPSMENLRGAFTTRAQTISACCLLSGDSEEQARNRHHSHEHWLGVLEHSVIELAEAVAIFADILPRKAPQKLRDLTVTVVPALQALTLLPKVLRIRFDPCWKNYVLLTSCTWRPFARPLRHQ